MSGLGQGGGHGEYRQFSSPVILQMGAHQAETLAIILTDSAVISRAHRIFSPPLKIELE